MRRFALVRSSFAPRPWPRASRGRLRLPRWTSTRTFVASLMRPASALAPTAADAKLRGKRVFRHHSDAAEDARADEQSARVPVHGRDRARSRRLEARADADEEGAGGRPDARGREGAGAD